jgi:hypothetical protein
VRHGSAEVLARLGRGEDVEASEYTFRASTQIETAAPDLEWLNKGQPCEESIRRPGRQLLVATLLPAEAVEGPAFDFDHNVSNVSSRVCTVRLLAQSGETMD